MEALLLSGLVLILIAAPLPFGSVQPAASAALVAACLSLGAAWVVWRSRRGISPVPWRDPVLAAGTLIILFGIVQTIPLPRPVVAWISPAAVDLRERYEPPERNAPGAAPDRGWRPISLYPGGTRRAALRFAACLTAALVAIDLAGREAHRRRLAWALAASGGFQAVYGLAEYMSGRQQIFAYAKRYYTDVVTGTFINRNHFAGYLEMTLPLALALAASSLSRVWGGDGAPLSRRLEEASGRRMFGGVILLILALTMATAIVCSRSRMGIASLCLALLSIGAFYLWRGRGKSFAVASVAVAGGTLVILSQAGAGAPLLERFAGAASEFHAEIGRWSMWSQAAGMVRAFWIAGAGLGAFPEVFPGFRTAGAGVGLAHAHNDFLEIAAETGAVGCALALLGVGLIARSFARQAERRPASGHLAQAAAAGLVALGFHSLADFNLAIPANALTLAVLAGIAICCMRAPEPALAADQAQRPRWLARSWVPAGLLAAAAIAAALPSLAGAFAPAGPGSLAEPASLPDEAVAGRQRRPSWLDAGGADLLFRTAAMRGGAAMSDLRALAQAQAAGAAASQPAAHYIERRLDEAIALQTAGLRRLPTAWKAHLALGQLEIERCAAVALAGSPHEGCLGGAVGEVRAAVELNPMGASAHAQAARLLVAAWPVLDDAEQHMARPIIERAALLNRNDRDLDRSWLALRVVPGAEAQP